VVGKYGSIQIRTDGTYTYSVNPASPSVKQLFPGQTLVDTFEYTKTNGARATLSIPLALTSATPETATPANTAANPLLGDIGLIGTEVSNVILYGENLRVEGASTTVEEGKNDLALGKVLIISKDGDSLNPNDDEAGGQLIFDFNGAVLLESVDLLDINEEGGTIEIFDTAGRLLSTTVIPALGENTFQSVFIQKQTNGQPFEASRMVITLKGDGAMANMVYTDVDPVREYKINHRYVEESALGVPHQITLTVEDDDGGITTLKAAQIEITNGPPIIQNIVTIPVTRDLNTITVLSKFVDSASDTHTVRVDFGDGTIVDATVINYNPVTGRYSSPTYPGTTDPVLFIDPATGNHIPVVDPFTGQFHLQALFNPITGKMAALVDPATGEASTSYAILDTATRQVYATHHYTEESTFDVSVTVTDEDNASDVEITSYRSFRPTTPTPPTEGGIKPVDIVQALDRLGFDIGSLVGGSGIFGERIPAGLFGGVVYGAEGGASFDGSFALFVGRTAPGGIVAISLYNELGDLVGIDELTADSDGYWLAQMSAAQLRADGHTIRSVQIAAPSFLDGELEWIAYDFALDGVIEDALRHSFNVGDTFITGRIISPIDAILEQ
jgi:VCBS repeat-containing protein